MDKFKATVSKMGRKKIINVPSKSPIEIGDNVEVTSLKKTMEE